MEYRLQNPNGHVCWVSARGRCHYDDSGAPVRFPGAAVDITDRKQAEEALTESEAQFRTLAQAMPSHVWTSAPSGLLDWFNDRVYDYSGMPRGSLDGEGWVDLVHPDDVENSQAAAG